MEPGVLTRRRTLSFAGSIFISAAAWRFSGAHPVLMSAKGYGTDPNLFSRHVPWSRSLTSAQLATLTALCDVVLPAEPPYPSAAQIGVQDFLNEWVSAPYPQMQADRTTIVNGLAALDRAGRDRWNAPFATADSRLQTSLFDSWCGGSELQVEFARKLISLVCMGYYTTRAGHSAIGYIGNIPLPDFPGPPAEVLRKFEDALRINV